MADAHRNVMVKVLVIDDDAVILNSIARQLKNEPFLLELESDPSEGLEKIQRKSYDLVLCDIKMKPMSGLEVLAEIKRKKPEIPVIIISAFVDDQLLENARQLGSSDFLIKPVRRGILVEAIYRVLRQR